MRRRIFAAFFTALTLCGSGCYTAKKYDLSHPKIEEFNPPPKEARYDNPPEDKYRKPPISKDLASKPNGGMGPVMPAGGGGPGQ